MKIYNLLTSELKTNTYIVTNGDRAFIVDPGGNFEKIKEKVNELGVKVEAVLLTHGHFDHTNAALFFQKEGALVFCHKNDLDKLTTFRGLAVMQNITHNKVVADVTLTGNEELNIAGMKIKVLWTPGHSSGGVCYFVEDNIFCGDTIFFMSYGRTDFFDGNEQDLKNSILNKLFNIQGDYKLYPGHGEFTTLAFEKEHNPIKFD